MGRRRSLKQTGRQTDLWCYRQSWWETRMAGSAASPIQSRRAAPAAESTRCFAPRDSLYKRAQFQLAMGRSTGPELCPGNYLFALAAVLVEAWHQLKQHENPREVIRIDH